MTHQFNITANNSKVIISAALDGFISGSLMIIKYYQTLGSVFESFRITIDINTSAVRVQTINQQTGTIISDTFLGNLIPATSTSGSLPYGSTFDLMFAICGDVLSISGRHIGSSGSLEPYNLSVASFGTPVNFINPLVSQATKVIFTGEGLVTLYFRPEFGINVQCSEPAQIYNQNWTSQDQQILIAGFVVGLLAVVLLIILVILYAVILRPVPTGSLT